MKRSGHTLVELIIVCFLLIFVMVGTFLLFQMGSRGFQQAVMRTGAVGDIHRLTRVVRRDIVSSHFYSVAIENRSVATPEGSLRRDGLSLAGLSSWSDADRFETGTGLPKWDRWIVLYATGEPLGRLVRLELDRPPPNSAQPDNFYPLTPLGSVAGFMADEPASVDDVLRVTTLCENVRSFQVETDPVRRLVTLQLIVHNRANRRMTSEDKVEEFLETRLELTPLNSYPDL